MKNSAAVALGTALLPSIAFDTVNLNNPGIQLYTVRKEMLQNAIGTMKQVAALGSKKEKYCMMSCLRIPISRW